MPVLNSLEQSVVHLKKSNFIFWLTFLQNCNFRTAGSTSWSRSSILAHFISEVSSLSFSRVFSLVLIWLLWDIQHRDRLRCKKSKAKVSWVRIGLLAGEPFKYVCLMSTELAKIKVAFSSLGSFNAIQVLVIVFWLLLLLS